MLLTKALNAFSGCMYALRTLSIHKLMKTHTVLTNVLKVNVGPHYLWIGRFSKP